MKAQTKHVIRKCRQFCSVNPMAFAEDVTTALSSTEVGTFENCTNILTEIIDRHAPNSTHRTSQDMQKPLYNEAIHRERLLRRNLERKWWISKLEIDKQLYQQQCDAVVNMINQAKAEYYSVTLASEGAKDMFRIVNLPHLTPRQGTAQWRL